MQDVVRARANGATQNGADAPLELGEIERLHHAVVSAEVKARDELVPACGGGRRPDGDITPSAELAQ